MNTLRDIQLRFQVLLERLKTAEAGELQSVFDSVLKETRKIFSEFSENKVSSISRTALEKQLRELETVNQALLDSAIKNHLSQLEELAALVVDFEGRAFQSLPAEIRLKKPDAKDAFGYALARPLSVNGEYLKPFVKDWGASEVLRINNTVRKAWGEGWTVDQLASAINGTKRNGYKDGILGAPGTSGAIARRNAEGIAQTSLQHVATSAQMATYEENTDVISAWQFDATLDSRTTQRCRSLDGQKFELGTGPVPPVHFRCRSRTIPVLTSDFSFLSEGRKRSSEFGPTQNVAYYDWLKKQSPEFQTVALGPTRAKLFRDGGLSSEEFRSLNLGRNFQPLKLEEMKKLSPLAFKKAGLE